MPSPLLERLVTLTRDLVAIPSTESRPLDRARCFTLLRNHLESLEGVCIRDYESCGYGSMTVMPAGIERPDVLMVAHLDVIEHPHVDAYTSRIADGRIYGPGSGDMKGQGAIMLELFRNLQREHPGLSLGLAYTSDEERGGADGVRFLFEDIGLRCGLAIVPDGGSIHDVTIAEKGILHLRLSAHGRESHAARPWLVPNALLDLTRAIQRLCDHFDAFKNDTPDHWYPTCVPTILNTPNETINCIPGEASAFIDMRFPPPCTQESLLATVRELAGEGIEIEHVMGAESTHLAPDPLYLLVTEELTGEPVRLVRASAGSDARFIEKHGIPVILSRPLVGNLHGVDEWIDMQSMELYYRICERFVLRKLGASVPT
ncbi:MAG: M20 family metallopeptidase [Verrucomicrobiaceae bacterium]|nr:M20 family metallopeptidase [Verrucomicrobiaceae bacterium]